MKAINDKLKSDAQNLNEPATIYTGPPVIRVTLASVEETSMLLSRGLDFYGATYFPTETPHPAAQPLAKYKNNRWEVNSLARATRAARDSLNDKFVAVLKITGDAIVSSRPDIFINYWNTTPSTIRYNNGCLNVRYV